MYLTTIALAYALASSCNTDAYIARHAGMDSAVSEEGVNPHAGVLGKAGRIIIHPS